MPMVSDARDDALVCRACAVAERELPPLRVALRERSRRGHGRAEADARLELVVARVVFDVGEHLRRARKVRVGRGHRIVGELGRLARRDDVRRLVHAVAPVSADAWSALELHVRDPALPERACDAQPDRTGADEREALFGRLHHRARAFAVSEPGPSRPARSTSRRLPRCCRRYTMPAPASRASGRRSRSAPRHRRSSSRCAASRAAGGTRSRSTRRARRPAERLAGSAATRATSKRASAASASDSNHVGCRGSHASSPPYRVRIASKNAVTTASSNAKLGGSCTSSTPRRSPSALVSARNASSASCASIRRRPCVIAFGTFSANRKFSGTLAAHRAYVDGRCGR